MRARRLPVVDEYVEDGRAAVYSEDGVVLVLSDLASCAWSVLTGEWTPASRVAEELVAVFGPPDDGQDPLEGTEAALRTLAEHSLVELDEDDPVRS